jgi:hypothetical protein
LLEDASVKYFYALLGFVVASLLVGAALSGDDKKTTKSKGTLPPGFKKLNLTDDQKSKIFAIQSSYRKQITALQKQIDDLKDKQKEEVFKVLTRPQKEKLLGAGTSDSKDKAVKDKKDK